MFNSFNSFILLWISSLLSKKYISLLISLSSILINISISFWLLSLKNCFVFLYSLINSLILKNKPLLKSLEFSLDIPINLLLDKLKIGKSLKFKFILEE